MIKRAAAAGAVAWTAPVILDSLASPAAAATAPVGCHRAQFNGTCAEVTPGPGGCLPTPWTQTPFPAGMITCTGSSTNIVTLTLPASSGCWFVRGRAQRTPGGNCYTGAGVPGTTITFTKTSQVWLAFRVVIACGPPGTVC